MYADACVSMCLCVCVHVIRIYGNRLRPEPFSAETSFRRYRHPAAQVYRDNDTGLESSDPLDKALSVYLQVRPFYGPFVSREVYRDV